jgi:hypothetical protein
MHVIAPQEKAGNQRRKPAAFTLSLDRSPILPPAAVSKSKPVASAKAAAAAAENGSSPSRRSGSFLEMRGIASKFASSQQKLLVK